MIQLKPGDVVTETSEIFFLVAQLFQGMTKQSKPYVTVTLQNKEVKADWVIWDTARNDAPVKAGDVIRIMNAIVGEYNGTLQFKNMAYEIISTMNSQQFLPQITNERKEYLVKEMESICKANIPNTHQLFPLVNGILFLSQAGQSFQQAPAAIGIHNAQLGGLLEHSLNVTRTALAMAVGKDVDFALLTAGAILHDIGKVHMYSYEKGIEITTAGALLDHIVLGIIFVKKSIDNVRKAGQAFDKELEWKLLHLIASHQMKREWGSPVEPMLEEALILAAADGIAARTETYEEEVLKVEPGTSAWSQGMKAFIFRPTEVPAQGKK